MKAPETKGFVMGLEMVWELFKAINVGFAALHHFLPKAFFNQILIQWPKTGVSLIENKLKIRDSNDKRWMLLCFLWAENQKQVIILATPLCVMS